MMGKSGEASTSAKRVGKQFPWLVTRKVAFPFSDNSMLFPLESFRRTFWNEVHEAWFGNEKVPMSVVVWSGFTMLRSSFPSEPEALATRAMTQKLPAGQSRV